MSHAKLPEITLLNGMLGKDFTAALDRHRELGIRLLDLKDSIFGKSFSDLTQEEARRARGLIEARELEVYTLSSSLCHLDLETGEEAFRAAVAVELKKVLETASVLRPKSVRLLSAWSSRREEFADATAYLDQRHPWIYEIYREGIDRLFEAGYTVFLENEAYQNIFSTPREITGFWARLDRGERVKLTWDIQNLWQMGTFPSLTVYEELRALVGYLHFKGGEGDAQGKLTWASALAEAAWPVAEVVERAIADGIAPVFCLNPSHGLRQPGYDADATTERDLLFLRELVERPRS